MMRQREDFERIFVEVPTETKLKERLKNLAKLHHRSVNQEINAILEDAVIVAEKTYKKLLTNN